ncbi:putative glyoxalase superfamily metalloenzyme YdcJ [Arthrobacter sp. CAN_A214]|uniref:2-oxoadipate dioxygenase/decarboxylase n=1 Tax=Arthrobacter sp. CAN_A214 TaxID=2787720 RepID=UPI0018CAD5A7
MHTIPVWKLRARFAERLSELYGQEVPAYNTLVEVSQEVNERVMRAQGADAERLGSISRVTAERHGAIRVGTPQEMRQVSRIFAALGMYPVGFYDLRDAQPSPIPVVSTAFRPLPREELALNPFRVFTSMLVPEDRRFFDAEMEGRLRDFLDSRTLFPTELLDLAEIAIRQEGLDEADTQRFLDLAASAFALSADPVDHEWYQKLEAISSVAADIGGVSTTHINHLTPRVLDIDDLYLSMQERGITMIDAIQGPPRWDGPDVLLRQTSFRALSESRVFRSADGSTFEGSLRVRFGEVEARGLALTPRGRDLYDELVARIDSLHAINPGRDRQDIAREVWAASWPSSERGFIEQDLAFFTFHPGDGAPVVGTGAGADLVSLIDQGVVLAAPIVYEDFLPRSAAGIFSSNLSGGGSVDTNQGGAARDLAWMSEAIGTPVRVPEDIYAEEREASLRQLAQQLGQPVELPIGQTSA